jgi:excisionase family DNA binding protein
VTTDLQKKRLDELAKRISALPVDRQEHLVDLMEDAQLAYTPAEAAKLCAVHPETVRRWIRSGDLPALSIGRDWRISKVELARFWRSRGGGELFPGDGV